MVAGSLYPQYKSRPSHPTIRGTFHALLHKRNNPAVTERKKTIPQPSLFTRFVSLICGSIGTSLRRAEVQNTEAVYESAILQRTHQHAHLRRAVAHLTYLRTRLENDLQQRQTDLSFVGRALENAVQTNEDTRALGLIRKKRTLS